MTVLPCRVVLVEPANAYNVGAAARACANFGVDDLVVVDRTKFSRALDRANKTELKARDLRIKEALEVQECRLDLSQWKMLQSKARFEAMPLLRKARLCSNLGTALTGARRVIAFSGVPQNSVRHPNVTLRGLAEEVKAEMQINRSQGVIAFLFGCETRGLPTEAFMQCDAVCQLKTAGIHGSLNLAQAVAVSLGFIFEMVSCPRLQICQQPSSLVTRSLGEDGVTMTNSSFVAYAPSQVRPGTWASQWMELCQSQLANLGYPATFTLHEILTSCARTLLRAQLTSKERRLWTHLVGKLSTAKRINVSMVKEGKDMMVGAGLDQEDHGGPAEHDDSNSSWHFPPTPTYVPAVMELLALVPQGSDTCFHPILLIMPLLISYVIGMRKICKLSQGLREPLAFSSV